MTGDAYLLDKAELLNIRKICNPSRNINLQETADLALCLHPPLKKKTPGFPTWQEVD